jgi:hypothetical protein
MWTQRSSRGLTGFSSTRLSATWRASAGHPSPAWRSSRRDAGGRARGVRALCQVLIELLDGRRPRRRGVGYIQSAYNDLKTIIRIFIISQCMSLPPRSTSLVVRSFSSAPLRPGLRDTFAEINRQTKVVTCKMARRRSSASGQSSFVRLRREACNVDAAKLEDFDRVFFDAAIGHLACVRGSSVTGVALLNTQGATPAVDLGASVHFAKFSLSCSMVAAQVDEASGIIYNTYSRFIISHH